MSTGCHKKVHNTLAQPQRQGSAPTNRLPTALLGAMKAAICHGQSFSVETNLLATIALNL